MLTKATICTFQMIRPKAWLEQETRDWLEKHPRSSPHEMHVHSLCQNDFAAKYFLMVQCAWRHRPANSPEPRVDSVQSFHVELETEILQRCGGDFQIIIAVAIRCREQRCV